MSHTFDKGNAFRFAWASVRARILFFVVVLAIYQGIIAAVQSRQGAGGNPFGFPLILSFFVSAFFRIGLIKINLAVVDEREPRYADFFGGLGFFVYYLIGSLAYICLLAVCLMLVVLVPLFTVGLGMMGVGRMAGGAMMGMTLGFMMLLGALVLAIPTICLAARFFFWSYFLVDRNAGPIESLQLSWGATRGVTISLLGFFLLVFGINLPGLIPMFLKVRMPVPMIFVIMGYLYECVAIPVTSIASAYIYRTLLSQMAEEGTLEEV